MCMFCLRHGEGKVWYKNAKIYARQMYSIRKREPPPPPGGRMDPEAMAAMITFEAARTRNTEPEKLPQIQEKIVAMMRQGLYGNPGQLVPLDDALAIAEISSPIALMNCICRTGARATYEDEKTRSCLGLGIGMFKWERWPSRYAGGVEFVDVDECKEWLEKFDKLGMCHVAMVFGYYGPEHLPYLGGICNCDYPVCALMRNRLDYGIPQLIKGEYVSQIDYNKCQGCFTCVSRCQFGAIKREVTIDKPSIDQTKCFGCGLCYTGCPKGAISMIRRVTLGPPLAKLW